MKCSAVAVFTSHRFNCRHYCLFNTYLEVYMTAKNFTYLEQSFDSNMSAEID